MESHDATRWTSRTAAHTTSGLASRRMVFVKSCSTRRLLGATIISSGYDGRPSRCAMTSREARGTKMSDATPATSKEQPRPSFWGRGAYELFLETEGIPVYTGVAVDEELVRAASPEGGSLLLFAG